MFLNVLRAQQAKTLRGGVFWVEIVLLAGVTALLTTLVNTINELSTDASPTMAGQLSEMLEHTGTSTLGHLLAVVLAGAVMANEYGWRSLHLWLSRGVSRSTFLWAKFVSTLLPIALFLLVTAAITAPIAAVFTQAEHGTIGPLSGELGGLAQTAALAAYAVVPYAALALLLAVLGRSMLVAVGGGLTLTLLAETLFVQIMGMIGGRAVDLVAYLPSALGPGMLGMDVGGAYAPLEPGIAALLTAGYTLVFMVAATLLFRRQDLSD
jgi:ABC-2 type transport system permease protein